MFHTNATTAINEASAQAPCGIGYRKGSGWFTYNVTAGCPIDCEPEFFVAKQGTLPLPLTETAIEVWLSVLRSA